MTSGTRLDVCYVLVGKGWDRHAQMAWLSATSLRLHEPECRITIVTDAQTADSLAQSAPRLREIADRFVTIASPMESPRLRAFHLKTALRRHLEGDVLYLDVDTLVIGPIADALEIKAEVAAATDFNHDRQWFPPQLREPFTKLGFTYPLPYYFNSGVLLLRDTAAVHALSEEWTRRWLLLVAENMIGDQEAFVSALYASQATWAFLPKAYNAITVKRNYRFQGTRILHFFGSQAEQEGTLLAHLLDHLQRTGQFDESAYRTCLREGHPWGRGAQPWQLWHSRNYGRAIALKVRQKLRGR